MAQFDTWRPSPKPRSPFAPQASPCTNIKSQVQEFLLFLLTVSQQRTPDLRLFSLARKSGMFQCTSNTRYLVMPPSSPSLKWHDETLVTGWKHFWKKVDYYPHLLKVRESGNIFPCNLQLCMQFWWNFVLFLVYLQIGPSITGYAVHADYSKMVLGFIFWGRVHNGIRSPPWYRCFQRANFDTPHGHHEFCMRFWPAETDSHAVLHFMELCF